MGIIALILLTQGVITKLCSILCDHNGCISYKPWNIFWRMVHSKDNAVKITQLRPYQGFAAEQVQPAYLQLLHGLEFLQVQPMQSLEV